MKIMKLIITLLLLMCSCTLEKKKDYEYINGQILFPDYTHDDTLIVVDAQYLNMAFKVLRPATDGDISKVLNLGCENYTTYLSHPEEYENIIPGQTDSFIDM